MVQPNFASALSDTGKMMNGSWSEPANAYAIAEQPEIQAFFADLAKVAPTLVGQASEADLLSLHRMGVACRLCGQYKLAESFYTKALDLATDIHGLEGLETATHRNFLAGLYFVLQRFDAAVALINVSLQVYAKVFGPEHIYTRLTHFALALAFRGEGDLASADTHFAASALGKHKSMEAQSGDRWSVFSTKLASLAALKYELGQYDEAVELFRHCVIHEANEAWPGSLIVARSLNGLAVLCRSQGLDQEAGEFYKMTLHMKKELCGEAHPEYQNTLNQYQELLASAARRTGNFEKPGGGR